MKSCEKMLEKFGQTFMFLGEKVMTNYQEKCKMYWWGEDETWSLKGQARMLEDDKK